MTKSSEWIRRVFLSATVTVLVAVVVALLSSCSIYKSNGRSSFEDRSSGNLPNTNNVGQGEGKAQGKEADTCWTQGAKEPLWNLPENEELRVHALSSELIEVCLVGPE